MIAYWSSLTGEYVVPYQCPGMNRRSWKPKDVVEHPCNQCGRTLEFWKDDVKVICSNCQNIMFNPNLGNICLAWCDKAAECLGSLDIEEWKRQRDACDDTETTPAKSSSK